MPSTPVPSAREPESPAPKRKATRRTLGAALLTLAAAVSAGAVIEPGQLLARLTGVDVRWFWATFALSLLQLALLGLRWSKVANLLGLRVGWLRATSEYALSMVMNQLLPSGYLGDGLRAVRASQNDATKAFGRVLEAIVLDRVSGQFALWTTALVSLVIWPEQLGLERSRLLLLGSSALGLAVLLLIVPAPWNRSRKQTWGWFAGARRVLFTLDGLLVHAPLSFALVFTLLLQLDFAARAVHIVLPWRKLSTTGPLLMAASSLPSLVGGLGVREAASALLFGRAGGSSSDGVAIGLVFGAFALITSLPGLLVLWLNVKTDVAKVTANQRAPLTWSLVHAWAMLLGTLFALWVQSLPVLAIIAGSSILVYIVHSRREWTPVGGFGVANAVTALRAALTLGMLVLHELLGSATLAALACVVLGLDGLDGWLARRHNLSSSFGSVFDIESDSVFVLVLSVLLQSRGLAGPWVLIAGLFRYIYVLAPLFVSTPEREAPRLRLGRLLYTTMVVSFVGALLLPGWSYALAALGTCAVSASFVFAFWLRYAPRKPGDAAS
jgi:phosphatidylglycerophosphate synthase/uncharacterized membrane protein YbhN (UPF0104 family)